MALWPNGRHMTRSTYKGLGVAPGLDARIKSLGDRMNRFIGTSITRTASTPDGYGMRGYVPPIKAGSMSTRTNVLNVSGTSNLLSGGPMTAAATTICTITGDNNTLSMIVSMSSTSSIVTLTGNNLVLALTIGLSGTSDLRGLLSLEGEWTPFTELSPEGLAAAVWNSLAANFNELGTMGNKLNTASSGGDPWTDTRALTVAKFLGLK